MINQSKKIATYILILGITFLSFNNIFALDYFQKTIINGNKSGTIEIRYSVKNSDLGGADSYKTLPFTEAKIKSAYASDNNKIQSVNVNTKDKEKTIVLVKINFKYFGKINSAPAFSKVKLTYFEKDDFVTMMYELPANNDFPSDFNPVYTFELPAKEITKTSGTIKGTSVVYGLTSEKVKNGITLFANYVSSGKNTVSENNKSTNNNNKKEEKEEGGSCGLFGLELPIILGLGYTFNRKFKKKK